MVSINELLPKELQEIVHRRVKEMRFDSAQEYIEALIKQDDEETDWIDPPNLEQLLLDGLNSGPGVVVDEAFWAERRRKLEEHIKSKAQ